MRFIRGFLASLGIFGTLVGVLLSLAGIYGWINNILLLVASIHGPINALFLARVLGIPIAVLGAVLGFVG